jgi:hypothetical protein
MSRVHGQDRTNVPPDTPPLTGSTAALESTAAFEEGEKAQVDARIALAGSPPSITGPRPLAGHIAQYDSTRDIVPILEDS